MSNNALVTAPNRKRRCRQTPHHDTEARKYSPKRISLPIASVTGGVAQDGEDKGILVGCGALMSSGFDRQVMEELFNETEGFGLKAVLRH